MTLEDLGNLGEFVGAIGVVATLAYLAIQIRQNTRAIRSNTSQAITEARVEFLSSITDDADVARIFYDGLVDRESLKGLDRGRFDLLMNRFTAAMENYYYQHRQGAMDVEQWDRMVETLRSMLVTRGMQSWVANRMIRADVPFDRFLEAEFERARSSPGEVKERVDSVIDGWSA